MPATEQADRIAVAQAQVADQATDGYEVRRVPVDRVEIRSNDDGGYTFEGHAAVFNEFSEDLGGGFGGSFREVIKRGAFKRVLDNDVRLLFNHNPDYVLARTTSGTLTLSEDPKGLRAVADVAPVSYAQDLRVLIDRGDVSQMSFAFRIGQDGADEWMEDENGNVTRTILRVGELMDASIVTYPAYPQTDAGVRGLSKLQRGEHVTQEERAAIEALLSTDSDGSEQDVRASAQEPHEQADSDGASVDDTQDAAWRAGARQRVLEHERKRRLLLS